MENNPILEAGALLLIETGEYSDRMTSGPFRVLKTLDRSVTAKAFIAEFKPSYEDDRPSPDDYLPWLIKNGYVEDVESTLWHVGSYGDFRFD